MKYLILLTILVAAGKLLAQDLTDAKSVNLLKNVKYKSSKNENVFSVVLADNSMLGITYHVVEDGEYNATYTFIRLPENFSFQNDPTFNWTYLTNNVSYWCGVLKISPTDTEKIKSKIKASKSKFVKGQLFSENMEFMEGYDEFAITFSNSGNLISCEFFFRRLL